jgi:hypothetical protein
MRNVLVILAGIYHVVAPPPQYDYPFAGDVLVKYDAYKACPHSNALGCAVAPSFGTCVIHMRPHLPTLTRSQLYHHEQAHCNGWPEGHPGGT